MASQVRHCGKLRSFEKDSFFEKIVRRLQVCVVRVFYAGHSIGSALFDGGMEVRFFEWLVFVCGGKFGRTLYILCGSKCTRAACIFDYLEFISSYPHLRVLFLAIGCFPFWRSWVRVHRRSAVFGL